MKEDSNNNSTAIFNYLHIDHFNKMRFISEEEYVKLSSLFEFSFLSSMDDDIGKEINRFFEMIIPNNNDDLLNICINLANKYKMNYNPRNDINDQINRILSMKNNMELELNITNTNDIALILAYAYIKIENNINASKNGFSENDINYEIQNFEQLLKKVDIVLHKNIDVVNYYINKQKRENEGGTNTIYLNTNIYQYPKTNKEIPKKIEKILPVEMIILINKFNYIRKLYLSIDDIDSKRNEELLIILLNNKWLFPNVIEIELDLTNDPLQQKLEQIFQYNLNTVNEKANRSTKTTKYNSSYKSKCTWNPNVEEMSIMLQNEDNSLLINQSSFYPLINEYDEDESSYQDEIRRVSSKNMSGSKLNISKSSRDSPKRNKIKHQNSKHSSNDDDESKSLTKFVVNNQEPFKTIIIYSYFISTMPRVNVLSLIFQDSYNEEINIMLQKNNIVMMNFSFLNFISKMNWLYDLSLDFNSLNMKTFEKLITLIHKNTSLSSLRINFFVNENQYSPSGLFKLAEELNLKTNLLPKEKTNLNNQKALRYDSMDFDIILINRLINNFAENIQKLFFVIQSKQTLKEISLYFDIPSVLVYDDSYSLILLKFMVNFLLFLTYEPNRFNKVDIVAPYLKLDNRRFPIIEELFEEINLYNDDIKNSSTIKHLVIQIQMYKILNIKKLISLNLMKLFLGDLDRDTFDSFLQHYTSSSFQNSSMLVSIKISLSIIEVVYEDVKELVMLYLKTKPKRLCRQDLISSLKFKSKENMKELLHVLYNENKVKQTYVEIAMTNRELLYDCYNDLENEKLEQLTAIGMVFIKKNLFKNSHINNAICKEVKEYLLPSKSKKVYCKNY